MIPASVLHQRDLDRQVAQFEGLVYETARQIVAGGVELEFDDVRQLLRIKVLYAIRRYSTERSKLPFERFVFGCVRNVRKDIEQRRPRRHNGSIEELRDRHAEWSDGGPLSRSDWFDERYLSSSAEQIFFEVEDEEPSWMSHLSCVERQVVRLKAEGLTMGEVDQRLGLGPDRARLAMQSVREKLADWRPPGPAPRIAPMPPLPAAAPQTVRPPLARAA